MTIDIFRKISRQTHSFPDSSRLLHPKGLLPLAISFVFFLANPFFVIGAPSTPTTESGPVKIEEAEEAASEEEETEEVEEAPPGDDELMAGIEAFYEGRPDDAYSAFEEARKANPDLAPAGVLTAILTYQRGDLAGTHRYLNRAILESPEDPEAWLRLARIAADEDRLPELDLLLAKGEELLARWIADYPTDIPPTEEEGTPSRIPFLQGETISLAARRAQLRGDLPEAERLMREFTEKFPDNDEGFVSLGYLYLEQEKIDEAVGAFDQAFRLNPARLPGWLTTASMLSERDRRSDAEGLVDRHWKEETLRAGDLFRIASLLLKWDRMEDARQIANRIPSQSPLRRNLNGLLAYYDGDFEKAEEEYQASLLMNPQDRDATLGYILAEAEQGNDAKLRSARDRADKIRKRDLKSDEATATLAWTEFLLDRPERAEDLLLPILERGALTPTSAYYLARVAAVRGDLDLAQRLVDLALQSGDNYPKRKETETFRHLLEQMETDPPESSD